MDAHGLIVWLIIGAIAGWLAGLIVRGGGYGVVGDIVVGIIGAVVFGWLFGSMGLLGSGLIGSVIAAGIGAGILILVLRLVARVVYPARRRGDQNGGFGRRFLFAARISEYSHQSGTHNQNRSLFSEAYHGLDQGGYHGFWKRGFA